MQFAKRMMLFFSVNILILITLSILLRVFGVTPYLTAQGIDYGQLALFCLIWGFGGAFISLGLSRLIAKWMMGVQLIDAGQTDADLRWVVETVHQMARKAGLSTMPEVGLYQSNEVNAFATGPTRNRALVAVSSGLLARMNRDQVAGVLGHEVAHVANGDMVTMTLLQGVVNAFVMFIARVIAFAVSANVREESRYMVHFMVTLVLEIALSILGMMVVAAFSRRREYRADRGGAQLAGRERMIEALRGLQGTTALVENEEHGSLATLKISGKRGGFAALFSTHPPLEKRIRALEMA